MSVPIAGILLDPYGEVANFAEIKFITVQGAGEVMTTAPAVYKTSADGAYAIDVQFGVFIVQMRYNQSNGKFQQVQKVIVNSNTVATTLGELLLNNEPLTPPEIAYVEQLVAEAKEYRDESEAFAIASESSAQNSATSAAESAQSAIDAANSAALIAPIPLNGGVWASGQTYDFYNQYMIYNGEAYSPLPATVLPYTVGAAPDLGFVYQIKLNDHSLLANRNAVNAHDGIYSRNFDTILDLKSGTSSDGTIIDMTQMVGAKVFWRGYYAESDGGSNWGIVKTGAHTGDGGSIFSIDANTYVEANLKGKTVNVLKFGVVGDGVTDDSQSILNLIAYFNASSIDYVNINLAGKDVTIQGNEIFKFTRVITKLKVTNGLIIWKNADVNDRLFLIDINVGRIVCEDVDIFTDTDAQDNIPKGDIFYFLSVFGEFASTHNEFSNMHINGSNVNYAPIRNIFNTQGHGNNDQTKVTNCRFESFYTVFRCNNPESVGWVFDMCGIFTVTTNARMFWFDTLSSGFTIKRGSFSMIEQTVANYQILLYNKSNNPTYPPSDEASFLMEGVRIETYSGSGTENIRIVDIDFGRLTMRDCITNAGNDVVHDFHIKGGSAMFIDNSSLGSTQFITTYAVQSPPYQPDFLTIKGGTCRNIPKLVSNAAPLAYEYINPPFEARSVAFDNVLDVATGSTLNFTSFSERACPAFKETLLDPNGFSILQPFSLVNSIRFNLNKNNTVSYPKVRITVAKGAYVVSFDLATAAGDFEVLPTDKHLMYLFDSNDTNLSFIQFQLLDQLDVPSLAVIEADVELSYSALSPRVAAVVGNVDIAKIVNIFGA